jgi:hypothetical protein
VGGQAGEQVGGQVHVGVCAEVGRRVRWTASAIVGYCRLLSATASAIVGYCRLFSENHWFRGK